MEPVDNVAVQRREQLEQRLLRFPEYRLVRFVIGFRWFALAIPVVVLLLSARFLHLRGVAGVGIVLAGSLVSLVLLVARVPDTTDRLQRQVLWSSRLLGVAVTVASMVLLHVEIHVGLALAIFLPVCSLVVVFVALVMIGVAKACVVVGTTSPSPPEYVEAVNDAAGATDGFLRGALRAGYAGVALLVCWMILVAFLIRR